MRSPTTGRVTAQLLSKSGELLSGLVLLRAKLLVGYITTEYGLILNVCYFYRSNDRSSRCSGIPNGKEQLPSGTISKLFDVTIFKRKLAE